MTFGTWYLCLLCSRHICSVRYVESMLMPFIYNPSIFSCKHAVLVGWRPPFTTVRMNQKEDVSGLSDTAPYQILVCQLQVFTSASSTVFKTFACDDGVVHGHSYLRADYSLSCKSRTHRIFKIYAGLMMVVSKTLCRLCRREHSMLSCC